MELAVFYEILPHIQWIFMNIHEYFVDYFILSIPQNIIMGLNNVMSGVILQYYLPRGDSNICRAMVV